MCIQAHLKTLRVRDRQTDYCLYCDRLRACNLSAQVTGFISLTFYTPDITEM